MTEPLVVDPASLSGAGSAVAATGDGLVAALSTLTAAYNADTGQDPAGAAFGYVYQDSGSEVVAAVAAGVNALRTTGYLVQVSATNYSMAEAAADIGRRASPLPTPAAPTEYPTPGGDPDVNGPGTSPPVLWYLVQAFVGNVWPNGKPAELRAAAGAWRQMAEPLAEVASSVSGPATTIGAQRIPEQEAMRTAVSDIGTAMTTLAGHGRLLATELDGFADDVQTAQNAVRRLLDTLKSVVGSVIDKGILGTVFELVTGDADDKIREVAADIKAVVNNHKRQADARKELVARLKEGIKTTSRELQVAARKELVEHLGSTAGNHIANLLDARTDFQLGLSAMGPLNLVEGVLAFDPSDPKGALESLNGMAETAMLFNPATALPTIAMDPQGSWEALKGMVHADDIFTSDRPFLGVGALGFDVATAVVPGGAATKAGSVAKVGDDIAQGGRAGRTGENIPGGLPEIAQSTRELGEPQRSADAVSDRLDDRAGAPVDLPPVSGKPVPGPQLPELPAPPVARGGDPTSPVNPTPEVAAAPRADPPFRGVVPDGGPRTEVPAVVPRGEVPAVSDPELPDRQPAPVRATMPTELAEAEAPVVSSPKLSAPVPSSSFLPQGLPGTPESIGAHGDGSSTSLPSASTSHVEPGHGDARGLRTGEEVEAETDNRGAAATNDREPSNVPDETVPPLLVRDHPYETGGMQSRYTGEQYPGGPMGSPGVEYLDELAREDFRITIREGLVYDGRGNLFDTASGVSAFGPGSHGRAIFVMDQHGNLYASTYQALGQFHHSSLLAGGDVAAAGELVVRDGRIELVTDHSGHYLPGRARTHQMLDELARQGVFVGPENVDYWAPPGS